MEDEPLVLAGERLGIEPLDVMDGLERNHDWRRRFIHDLIRPDLGEVAWDGTEPPEAFGG